MSNISKMQKMQTWCYQWSSGRGVNRMWSNNFWADITSAPVSFKRASHRWAGRRRGRRESRPRAQAGICTFHIWMDFRQGGNGSSDDKVSTFRLQSYWSHIAAWSIRLLTKESLIWHFLNLSKQYLAINTHRKKKEKKRRHFWKSELFKHDCCTVHDFIIKTYEIRTWCLPR